ncbi:cupin domain-containing protein [Paenibacillus barcinonensis]|nr:cupin domain-containing protein [Paenibacillus barcinonensis]QKS59974.1 cupin domain-containing protein [Paenibacillus barcinonensis]
MSMMSLQDVKAFSKERFTKRILSQQGGGVTFVLHFLPGQELPVHMHPGATLTLLVVEGGGTVILDGIKQRIQAEDVVSCSGETAFAFHNTSDAEVRLFVVLSKVPEASYAKDI